MFGEASAFATIVGLLGAFSSGREAKSTAEIAEFTQWLVEHKHEDLAGLIEQNYNTTISIKALLNQQSAQLGQKLDSLAKSTARIAGQMPDLDKLAASLIPNFDLSEQALSILSQMAEKGIEWFLIHRGRRGKTLVPDNGSSIEHSEERFLSDDLATLVELQLLRHGHNSKGDDMYHFTRAAAKLVEARNGGVTL